MAALEDVCQLSRERKFDMAAKVALENWGRLTNMEPQERHNVLTTTQPREQTIIWIAVLYVLPLAPPPPPPPLYLIALSLVQH